MTDERPVRRCHLAAERLLAEVRPLAQSIKSTIALSLLRWLACDSSHVNQCRELFSDKEQGFVRTAWSTAMFTAGVTALRKAITLPGMLLEKAGSLWRQAVEHERIIMAMLFVVSCEFVPRMARELASQVDLHLQLCAVNGTVALTTGGEVQAGAETPDMWTRGAWIAVAVGAHAVFVSTVWWEIHPLVRQVIFDDV